MRERFTGEKDKKRTDRGCCRGKAGRRSRTCPWLCSTKLRCGEEEEEWRARWWIREVDLFIWPMFVSLFMLPLVSL